MKKPMTRLAGLVCLMVAALVLPGCGDSEENLDTSRILPQEFGYQVTPQTVALIEGKEAYETYCIGCHGADGGGMGEAAKYLNPRPRNFQKAEYKFISTRFGELPTDEDLFRSISEGLRGSAMPAWGHLPERKRWALVAYIKSFSDVWERGETPAIPVVTDPYVELEDKSEAIARGEIAYHGFFTCWNCHPAYVSTDKINAALEAMGGSPRSVFRPDLDQTAIKADSSGETIFAPDFLRDYVKSGSDVRDLYRVIGAGITGTAMPTWIDSVADDVAPRDDDGDLLVSQADIWAMAYYVKDLMKQRKARFQPGEVEVRDDRALALRDGRALYIAQVPDAGNAADMEDAEEFVEEDEFEEDDEDEEVDEDE
jgi:hypothetical protein